MKKILILSFMIVTVCAQAQWTTSGSNIYWNGTGNAGIGTNNPLAKLSVLGSIWSNSPSTNTVFSGLAGESNANFIGTDGYWSLRTAVNNSFNLDVYNSAAPISAFTVLQNGNIGIGTTAPDAKLAVKGTIHAQEVKVDLNVPGPDYVFEENYNLPSLTEIENYIKQNKHLPEVPSAKEMETNGINLSEMNMLLLKKVEEITLHLIELKKENDTLKAKVSQLEKK